MLKRWDVLISILKDKPHAVGAEIGVWKGDFVYNILKSLPNVSKYYCVDLWEHYDDFTKILNPKGNVINCNFNDIYSEYRNKTKKFHNKIEDLKMSSLEASFKIADNS